MNDLREITAFHEGYRQNEWNAGNQEVAEKLGVPQKDGEGQGQGGQEEHLVVRQAKTEDKRGDAEQFVAGLRYPFVR